MHVTDPRPFVKDHSEVCGSWMASQEGTFDCSQRLKPSLCILESPSFIQTKALCINHKQGMAQNYWSQNWMFGRPQMATHDWHISTPVVPSLSQCHISRYLGIQCFKYVSWVWNPTGTRSWMPSSLKQAMRLWGPADGIRTGYGKSFSGWRVDQSWTLRCSNDWMTKPGMFLSL